MIPSASWLDWKLAARMLVKYPGLSIIGGLTLAAAIGLGAGWFEASRQYLGPRLPLSDGDRIVRVDNWDAAAASVEPRAQYDFLLWREQLASITELGAYRSLERNLITEDGNALAATVAEITPSAFPLTRVPPLLGRTLIDADAEPGAADVVLIGYDVWKSRFNRDPAVIGRTARLGRTPVTIVGVMPERFRFPTSQQLWVPLRVTSAAPRQGPPIQVFGRLAARATLESAQAELTTIGQRIATMNPRTHAQLRPRVSAYAAPGFGGSTSSMIRLANIAAWLILVAACMNVATLMFARTATREAEVVVRNALGASRTQVMMQLFVEAFVLCAVAALVGLAALTLGFRYVGRLLLEMGIQLPFWWQLRIGPATVAYSALLALSGAALVGFLPAFKATGSRVQSALTRIASGGTSMRFGGVWSLMIVLQVACVSLCLPIALDAAWGVLREHDARPDWPSHEYLTFRAELDRVATPNAPASNVYAELERRLESEPAVIAVTFANAMPGLSTAVSQLEAQRGNEPPSLVKANIDGDRAWIASVDTGFFAAFRLPLVAGRAFNAGDVDEERVVIVNEALARNLGGNALGVRVRYPARGPEAKPGPWYEVVGVVRDAGKHRADDDFMYVPVSAARVSPLVFAIHVRGNAAGFSPRLRALATDVEPELRLHNLLPLDEAIRRRDPIAAPAMAIVGAITILIIALSAASLYSLMSVSVTRRTREIGIRRAIGATQRSVLAAVFGRAALQVGIGLVAGNALLPPLMTALGNIEPLSELLPRMLVACCGMLLVGLVACCVPALRALRVQPTEAVRYVG